MPKANQLEIKEGGADRGTIPLAAAYITDMRPFRPTAAADCSSVQGPPTMRFPWEHRCVSMWYAHFVREKKG